MKARTLSLAATVGIDLAVGEPPADYHPVVFAGRALALGTDRFRMRGGRAQLLGGAATLLGTAMAAALTAAAIERLLGRRRVGWLGRGAALKPFFAVRMLLREARSVGSALDTGDLDLARERLRSLVSRPTADLGPGLVAAAAIESLAENLGDSIVAPCLYFAGFGLPGAAVYRVVSTADSMYGYHGENEWLGKVAAKTDDVLSWLPSRLAATAIVGAARLKLGRQAAASAVSIWRSDGGLTASPNAGRPMAAMAGALRRRLEKREHYVLGGEYPEPSADDVGRAVDLTATATFVALSAIAAATLITPSA